MWRDLRETIAQAARAGRGVTLTPRECAAMARDGDLRMLGVLDGTVHALLDVRQEIRSLNGPYRRIDPRHTKKIAMRDAILAPLLRLEKYLDHQADLVKAVYEKSTKGDLNEWDWVMRGNRRGKSADVARRAYGEAAERPTRVVMVPTSAGTKRAAVLCPNIRLYRWSANEIRALMD